MAEKDAPVLTRFRAWTDAIGVNSAALLIEVSPSAVHHFRAGRTRPGLDTAIKIERATRSSPVGCIRCSDWLEAKPRKVA